MVLGAYQALHSGNALSDVSSFFRLKSVKYRPGGIVIRSFRGKKTLFRGLLTQFPLDFLGNHGGIEDFNSPGLKAAF